MTNQTVVSQAVETVVTGRPVGMPATALQVDGAMWIAVIPTEEWCDDGLYSPHMFNRDGLVAAKKKDHLQGEVTTDIQRTVIACIDDTGTKTKLDGHCRAKAWAHGKMAKPAQGTVICIIHQLPDGMRSDDTYVATLLKHAINKAGKLTAPEEKKSAQMWSGVRAGFVATTDFVVGSISKACFSEAKKVASLIDVTIPAFTGELVDDLAMSAEFRKLAETFEWSNPKANADIEDKAARAKDLAERKFVKSATMAAAFLVSHSMDAQAAACYWSVWGTEEMADIQKVTYADFTKNQGAKASDKLAVCTRAVGKFKEWLGTEWVTNRDALIAREEARMEAYIKSQETPDVGQDDEVVISDSDTPFEGEVLTLGELAQAIGDNIEEEEAAQDRIQRLEAMQARLAALEEEGNDDEALVVMDDIDQLLAQMEAARAE